MRKFGSKLKASLILIGLMLLWSCTLPALEDQRVSFFDDEFSVIMPAGWSLQDDLNEEADLQMGLPLVEAYALIFTEHKMDFDDSMTLEEHSQLTRESILQALRNPDASEGEKMDVNGIPGLSFRITGSIDRTKIIYWHVTLETEDHYHQLLLWSLPSKFKKLQKTYEEVIQSFRVD